MSAGTPAGWPVAVLGPFHPYRGGIAQYTTLLARTLERNHRVFGVNFRRLYPSWLFPGRTQLDPSAEPLSTPGMPVERLLDSMAPHTWWRTARRINAAGSRLLVMQWWHPFFAPAYASVALGVRRRGVRVLMVCHNVLPHESSRLDGVLVRLGLGRADAYLVHSQTDAQALQRLFPRRPRALARLPVFDFFARRRVGRDEARSILALQGPVVLFFGLVRRYKGLDVLLRAVARARRQVPLTLLVVGEFYEPRAPYESLRDSLGLQQAVRFLDRYVPNEEVETYFQAADVVVLPYRSATQSAIVQIALSFQRPAIVTRVGGLPEAVRPGETGEVVPPEDPEALGAALVRFFTGHAAATMAPFLRDAAADFSWEALDAALHGLAAQLGLPSA